jgi:hypothetical protein
VSWWNIVTGAHRQLDIRYKKIGVAGAAPHGLLVLKDNPAPPHNLILEADRFDGTLHPLDAPFPKLRVYGIADANGLVAVYHPANSSQDGAVKVVSFTKPGQARTLASSGLGAHVCPSVTRKYVACEVIPNQGSPNLQGSMHLLSTDGRRSASTTKGCTSPYAAVLGNSAAWIVLSDQACPAYHLWTLNINGTVSTSTRTYAQMPPVAAFHEIVVATRSHQSLDELSSANAKPRVLVNLS